MSDLQLLALAIVVIGIAVLFCGFLLIATGNKISELEDFKESIIKLMKAQGVEL